MKKEEFIQFVAKNIKYHLPSEFKDFKIEVPKLVFQNIAESIDVTMTATYSPYVKKQ